MNDNCEKVAASLCLVIGSINFVAGIPEAFLF